jgi:hypothetical protein
MKILIKMELASHMTPQPDRINNGHMHRIYKLIMEQHCAILPRASKPICCFSQSENQSGLSPDAISLIFLQY